MKRLLDGRQILFNEYKVLLFDLDLSWTYRLTYWPMLNSNGQFKIIVAEDYAIRFSLEFWEMLMRLTANESEFYWDVCMI